VVVDDDVFAWNFGARASTNFYGTFSPHVGSCAVFATHCPVGGYSYAPAWRAAPRSQGVSVSLSNTIALKTASGAEQKASAGGPQDTTQAGGIPPAGEETLRKSPASSSGRSLPQYNPDAGGHNWSNVQSSVNRLRVFGTFVGRSARTIDPYEWDVLSRAPQTQISLNGTHRSAGRRRRRSESSTLWRPPTLPRDGFVVGEPSSPLSGKRDPAPFQ